MIRAQNELSRTLVYVTRMACGVLAAIAAEILLRRTGVEIADTWRSLASGQLQMRAVSVLWLMIGSAFVVSAVVAAALSRLPPPGLPLRTLRWPAGVVLGFSLSVARHIAAHSVGHGGRCPTPMMLAAHCAPGLVARVA